MELVMLKEIDKKGLLHSCVERKKWQEQEQEKENSCNVVVYDPKPQEVVDSAISEKLAALKKEKTQKMEGEATEREKFMNAVTFTDVPATIKKAGFHRDGSPKVAIAGIFDKDVEFIIDDDDGRAKYRSWNKYRSNGLSVDFAEVKNDWRNLIVFFVGLAGVIASMLISVVALSAPFEVLGFYNSIVLIIVGIFIPLITLFFVAVFPPKNGSYFTYIMLPDIGKVRTRSNFYTDVPPVPESVLTKIPGQGPFAILFEVTEGWRKVDPDPVVLRVINVYGQQFFEPVVGYEMTPLEKSSLTEA